MLSLGAGLEVGEALADAVFDAAVVTELEVQAVIIAARAPVTAIERVATPAAKNGTSHCLAIGCMARFDDERITAFSCAMQQKEFHGSGRERDRNAAKVIACSRVQTVSIICLRPGLPPLQRSGIRCQPRATRRRSRFSFLRLSAVNPDEEFVERTHTPRYASETGCRDAA